jgi:aminoglycoside phosphotransferase (APT) family kinase protein
MTIDPELLAIAADLLPDADLATATVASGQFHDVVLVRGVAAVRVARNGPAADALPRRTAIIERLAAMDLPFAVPRPLTEVRASNGRTAVAVSWVDGADRMEQVDDPAPFRTMLTALSSVDISVLADVLYPPHEYAGGDDWPRLMLEDVVPLFPAEWRAEAAQRFEAAIALPEVEPSLVHGDLSGHNLHWDADGALVGVLDWDVASAWDPAIDVACLAGHGWATLAQVIDAQTYERAAVWYRTFGIEQLGAALLTGEPAEIDRYVRRGVQYLERTNGWEPPPFS